MHKADIALGAIYYCLDPYNFTTYTVPLSRSGLTVVVPKPGILAPWKTPFLSFSGLLWAAVAASFVVGLFFIWFLEKAQIKLVGNLTRTVQSVTDAAIMLIGLFIEQGIDTRPRELASGTVLFVSMLFAGFMIGNIYTAGLASIMTIPQYAKSIDTAQDLAASGLPWGGTAIAWIFAISTATEVYF
ncbi:glutamate receptor-like [Culex pipiens pallens]|uniref:glutamate receptor-like n=1 Tax=Culex pipiens pallens TaxID=42434 RepID=UPI0022AA53F8|nr:glutamate receptor-like [Culex pipiens pallens]